MLVVSHESYESCLGYLFVEVYVNQRQIWDTLPTSKMELFVIKRICKVISCRLMVFYTQYCPISVFSYVSLLISFRSRWFHLQTSKMVLFATITIAIVVFYWGMVLQAQFLLMNFLFFVSVRCWFHLVTDEFTLF